MFNQAGQLIDALVRGIALLAFLLALLILATHWAVRNKTLTPFGWWPRSVRRWGDPVLHPLERRLHRAGANPQDAPLWLLGGVLVAGLLLISAARWLLGHLALLESMQGAGARDWIRLALAATLSLISFAILLRVIGSWLGLGRSHRWMRPAYFLSDWIVEPIRRRIPAFGPLDLSPVIAYFALLLLRFLLLELI